MSSKNKIDKKTLKGPDTFVSLSDRAFSWVEANAKLIGTLVVGILVIAAGYVAYQALARQKEAKAAQALFKPESVIEKAEQKLREEQAKAAQDKGQSAPEGDYAKDFAPAVQEMKAALKDHSGTRAALVSALNLAAFLLEKKQAAEALEVVEIPRYQPGSENMLNGFYQMHRGVVYIENKKYDDAEKAYEAILKAKSLKYFHPEAMLKLGVTYELKGDAGKARETYQKLEREFPQTEASKTAQQYMRLLDMKPQQG